MKTLDFIACLDKQKIPPEPPEYWRYYDMRPHADEPAGVQVTNWRDECCKRGMWALVYRSWVHELAAWIGKRRVLEVMAGRGWLAKALSEEGIFIVATDDNSWDDRHSKAGPIFTVGKMDAVEAARTIDADMLIISWPPYGDEIATEVTAAWGEDRPIIYIGESRGGCNAPDSFWQHWREDHNAPDIPLAQWDGIHDMVCIGYYVNTSHHVCQKCGGWAYENELCSDCAYSEEVQ